MNQPVNKAEVPPTPIIDWSKAPEWAEAAVMNDEGLLFWIENPDSFLDGDGFWRGYGKCELISGVGTATDTSKYRESKVLRPLPTVDWSAAPPDATHWGSEKARVSTTFYRVPSKLGAYAYDFWFSGEWVFSTQAELPKFMIQRPTIDWSKAPDTATYFDTLRNWFISVNEDTGMVSMYQDGVWHPRVWLTGDVAAEQSNRFIKRPTLDQNVPPISEWKVGVFQPIYEHGNAERDQQLIDTLAAGCADLGIAFDPSKVKIISGVPASLKNFFPDADTGLSVSLPLTGDYGCLADVLSRAYDQAASGKGAERHGQAKPFDDQPMQKLIDLYGVGFALGQAGKKAQESMRLPHDAAIRELLGAINYIAGAVIHVERNRK